MWWRLSPSVRGTTPTPPVPDSQNVVLSRGIHPSFEDPTLACLRMTSYLRVYSSDLRLPLVVGTSSPYNWPHCDNRGMSRL